MPRLRPISWATSLVLLALAAFVDCTVPSYGGFQDADSGEAGGSRLEVEGGDALTDGSSSGGAAPGSSDSSALGGADSGPSTGATDGGSSCSNGVRDSNESDVDCGGSCSSKCALTQSCTTGNDCASAICTAGVCVEASCTDLEQDGDESDVDCGGSCANKCAARKKCARASDCVTGVCSGSPLVCQAASCTDGVRDNDESDVDCGGSCGACQTGSFCSSASDCASGVCAAVAVSRAAEGGTAEGGTAEGGTAEGGVEADADGGEDGGAFQWCQPSGCAGDGGCTTAACDDTRQNGTETDVDCGGGTCTPCADGQKCLKASDCSSNVCLNKTCQAATCTDGVQNHGESSPDCGGVQSPSCSRCDSGKSCAQDSDCASLVCGGNGRCSAATCSDGVRNGDETAIDCGGSNCDACDNNRTCTSGADCKSGSCQSVSGSEVCHSATCADNVTNGTETDTDCGGSCASLVPPQKCATAKACGAPLDCVSGVCTDYKCVAPACNPGDGVQNGTETDVDCGGSGCPTCGTGKTCSSSADCASLVCSGSPKRCQAPSCSPGDGLQNGTETDVDCGGSGCPTCATHQHCSSAGDCASGVCTSTVCQAAKCPDGVKNGTETDVDCGGSCATKCAVSKSCSADGDCATGICIGGTCRNAACDDGRLDGSETDVDCGGATCRTQSPAVLCAVGKACGITADCITGASCSSGKCTTVSCSNGVQDGTETDKDCGGSCSGCADGAHCSMPADCANGGACTSTVCKAPTCSDSLKNQTESDVDCGGTCSKCADGKKCNSASDCTSGVCSGGVCQVPSCSPGDNVKNGSETDIDCGGASCSVKCVDSKSCLLYSDCANGVCFVSTGQGSTSLANTCSGGTCTGGACRGSTCSDGLQGGTESDVDCGGSSCSKCANAKKCSADTDCTSNVCNLSASPKACAATGCSDSRKNGTETDIDCGGGACSGCANGKHCTAPTDCANGGACTATVCQAPTCSDSLNNQTESDVDCGGTCSKCADGKLCKSASDCSSSVCSASLGTCTAATCSDGVQNHNETDVDCGGTQSPSCARCAPGKKCTANGDCASGTCTSQVCANYTLKVQTELNSCCTNASDAQIAPILRVVNTGSTAVAYSQLKIRYWFKSDGSTSFQHDCFYVGSDAGGCSNLTMAINGLSPTRTGADEYLEIGFGTTGSLGANTTGGDVQIDVYHTGWSPAFAEANHYSYNSSTTYVDWSKVTLYLDGVLVWGVEP